MTVIFLWPSGLTFLRNCGNMLSSYFNTTQSLSEKALSSHNWESLDLIVWSLFCKIFIISTQVFSFNIWLLIYFFLSKCFSLVMFSEVPLCLGYVIFFFSVMIRDKIWFSFQTVHCRMFQKKFVLFLYVDPATLEFYISWKGRLRLY